jgi:hypothetical protein
MSGNFSSAHSTGHALEVSSTQTQRRGPQMPVLFSAPLHLGFNPLCFFCRTMSGGHARR